EVVDAERQVRQAELVHRPWLLRPDPARHREREQLETPAVALEEDQAHLGLRHAVQRGCGFALERKSTHLLAAEDVAVKVQRALEVRDADPQVRDPLDGHRNARAAYRPVLDDGRRRVASPVPFRASSAASTRGGDIGSSESRTPAAWW